MHPCPGVLFAPKLDPFTKPPHNNPILFQGLSQSQEGTGERRQSEEAEPSQNSPPSIPIMASPAAEPPPKKRKVVDAQDPSPSSISVPAAPPSPGPPPPPETLAAAAPSTSSPPSTEPASLPLEEEKLQKRRNREELCKVMVHYRRIRDYIGQRKDRGLTPELEQDYLYLISASRGG